MWVVPPVRVHRKYPVSLNDALDSVGGVKVLGDDAPHKLSPSEHDVAGRLQHVGGGHLENQKVASGGAVEANGSSYGSG